MQVLVDYESQAQDKALLSFFVFFPKPLKPFLAKTRLKEKLDIHTLFVKTQFFSCGPKIVHHSKNLVVDCLRSKLHFQNLQPSRSCKESLANLLKLFFLEGECMEKTLDILRKSLQ